MERTTRKERKQNAKEFYQYLGYTDKAAIVILKQESKSNPNVRRVQFVTSKVNGPASQVVIAESVDGIAGCFYELVESLCGNIPQMGCFKDGFKDWLKETCRLNITFNDGLVILVEMYYPDDDEE